MQGRPPRPEGGARQRHPTRRTHTQRDPPGGCTRLRAPPDPRDRESRGDRACPPHCRERINSAAPRCTHRRPGPGPIALNRRMRRSAFACALGCLTTVVLSGCSSPPARPRPTSSVAPVRLVTAPPQAIALANAFEAQFVAGDYGVQWSELAPQAEATWPSEAARAAMLTRKFEHATVMSVSVGAPALESTWTAPENPSVQVENVWSFPLEVNFADPAALRPAGVAALFSMTSLDVALDPTSGIAEILGEGPESLDAPIIVPASIPTVSLDVPILMYHLVDRFHLDRSSHRTTDGSSRSASQRCRAPSTRRWPIS